MQFIFGIIAIILLLVMLGWLFASLAARRDRLRFPPPGQLISVNAHRLHLHAAGERRPGQPAIILEAGIGSCSFDWRYIQPAVSQWGHVCSYDRAGYGWSEPVPGVRAFRRMALELHTLLLRAGEAGPYVLVGHSYGGILVREFARIYPDLVAGMVLVDSAHEDQIRRLPPEAARQISASLYFYGLLAFLARVGLVRLLARSLLLKRFPSVRTPEEKAIFLTLISRPAYFDTLRRESQALLHTSIRDSGIPGVGAIPLRVIQATGQPTTLPRGYTAEKWQATRQTFDEIQRELVQLSSNSQLIQAGQSVHAVQLEQPEVVVAAIQQVITALQASA